MNFTILPCFRLVATLSLVFFATSAMTQNSTGIKTPANTSDGASAGSTSNDGSPKPSKKQPAGKTANVGGAESKPKPGQYGTEAEARSQCHGTVVWVDQDHFNHYAGSREYGRKPGTFACEGR